MEADREDSMDERGSVSLTEIGRAIETARLCLGYFVINMPSNGDQASLRLSSELECNLPARQSGLWYSSCQLFCGSSRLSTGSSATLELG